MERPFFPFLSIKKKQQMRKNNWQKGIGLLALLVLSACFQNHTLQKENKSINDDVEDCRKFIKVDSLQAIETARMVKFYPEKKSLFQSAISLEKVDGLCCWLIKSTCHEQSRQGQCAKTNGCTVKAEYRIYISTEDGLIRQKNKQEKFYPNYE